MALQSDFMLVAMGQLQTGLLIWVLLSFLFFQITVD